MIAANLCSSNEIEKAYGACRSLELNYKQKVVSGTVDKFKDEGFDRVYFFEDKPLDTQVILSSNDTDILITIPGTVGKQDMLTDMSFAYWFYLGTLKRRNLTDVQERIVKNDMKRAWKDRVRCGVPHFGFYFSVWRIFELNGVMDVLDNEEVAGKVLTICGHSLGGALAQQFAYVLAKRGIEADNVYTFGGPAPARKKFKKQFEKIFPNALTFIHESDIVPFMAPKFAGFKRCGREMHIGADNSIIEGKLRLFNNKRYKGRTGNKKFDIVQDHFVPEYIDGLKHNI